MSDGDGGKIEAMVLGRTLYDFLRKDQKYTLDECVTVGNEIKKGVYDERERLQNIHDSSKENPE